MDKVIRNNRVKNLADVAQMVALAKDTHVLDERIWMNEPLCGLVFSSALACLGIGPGDVGEEAEDTPIYNEYCRLKAELVVRTKMNVLERTKMSVLTKDELKHLAKVFERRALGAGLKLRDDKAWTDVITNAELDKLVRKTCLRSNLNDAEGSRHYEQMAAYIKERVVKHCKAQQSMRELGFTGEV